MLIISHLASGQSIDQTFAFANSLLENGRYQEAVESYKRVLFFDQDEVYGPKVYRNIADCLYQTGAFGEAAYYYDLAYFTSPSERAKVEVSLQKTSCHLILGEYNQAQTELFNIPERLPQELLEQKIFYEALLSFALNDFDKAEKLFKKVASDTLEVERIFDKNAKIDRLKPKTAKTLSVILPGLGQFYAGDIKNGLNSLLLTGGLMFIGIRSAINTSFIDAAISVLPWFQRYYTGGYKKAEVIAEAKIKERRYKAFNELLDLVE